MPKAEVSTDLAKISATLREQSFGWEDRKVEADFDETLAEFLTEVRVQLAARDIIPVAGANSGDGLTAIIRLLQNRAVEMRADNPPCTCEGHRGPHSSTGCEHDSGPYSPMCECSAMSGTPAATDREVLELRLDGLSDDANIF